MAAAFFPQGRIWGINQWAYFPSVMALLAGVVVLVFFIPSLNEAVRAGLSSLTSRVTRTTDKLMASGGKRRYLVYSAFSTLFFIPFWLLRERVYFLGDGAQIISRLNSGELEVHWAEPLETFLHIKIFSLVDRLLRMDASTLYALLSCLAGVIFVFLTLLLADLLGKERKEKVFVFLILLGMGSTQLFFGYVEHYGFLYVFVFAFILSSLAYLRERVSWFVPLTTFILAGLSHVSSLYLLPSLLFIFLVGDRKRESSSVKRILILASGLIFVLLLVVIYRRYSWTISPIFVPFVEDSYAAPGYLMFSLPHILDFLNQQLLVSPVGLIMLLAPFVCISAKSLFRQRAFRFLLLVSLFQLLFGFLVEPDLGASRDWDLFSVAGLGYTILGLYILLNLLADKPRFAHLGLILVVTSLYSTVPWIVLNSHAQKSISRFQNLLEIDVKKSYSGHFVLIDYLEAHAMNREAERQGEEYRQAFPEIVLSNEGSRLAKEGEFERALKVYLEAELLAPKRPEIHNNLGHVYLKLGRLAQAEASLNRAVQLGPYLHGVYVNLSDLHLMRQDYDRALDACNKAIRLKTDSPQVYSNAATIYLMRGNLKEAESHFLRALEMDRNLIEPYVGLGDIYFQRSRPQQAVDMYRTALTMDPSLAMARFRLGMTYLSLNARQEAKQELESFLLLSPQGPEADKAREVLNMLKEPDTE
jgi:tetratricopeptide (TPR) repeat protein